MFDERSNETLVLMTLVGDSGAYETLVKKYEKAVYASALSVTRAHHLAEDAAQDAFVSAWMKLNTLAEPSKFGAWVCRIAKNCAKNTLARFRAFLPLEDVEWNESSDVPAPEEELIASEENKELRETVARLPERVRRVIELHYFSDLPIEKIAETMGITVGTVKSQLYEGRRRLRKELSAMNEQIDDTMTEKVMKKVEELKLWALKNDKTGFEKVYEEVLSEVEKLPESEKKHHAMADVLVRGYWWLPGKANDELLARVKESALLGGNDEAMIYILQREDYKFYGKQRIEFMRDVQIPMLEKAGVSGALAYEWYRLAGEYYEENDAEKGKDACLRAGQVSKDDDPCRYLAPAGLRVWEKKRAEYNDERIGRFCLRASIADIRFVNRQPRCCGEKLENAEGYYSVIPWGSPWLHASRSDGRFYDEKLSVGETAKGSDGTALSRLPDETVTTPAGVFENCRLFETKGNDKAYVFYAWYKEDVGLVRLSCKVLGMMDTVHLSSYTVTGGKGLLPIAVGNCWQYVGTQSDEYVASHWDSEVVYANGEKAYILTETEAHRVKFDGNSLSDMLHQISQDYYKYVGKWEGKILDVSAPAARAEELAVTPLEKAYVKAACSVIRRIMDTAEEMNPRRKASGHWNFFEYMYLYRKNGRIGITTDYDARYSFEWKCTGPDVDDALLYNDIYGIFADCAGCLWNDDWQEGYTKNRAFVYAGDAVNTELTVSDGGKIEAEAGTFDNTVKVTLETAGIKSGLDYRGVKKDYWFASGIGIVRAVFYLEDGRAVTYDLSSYDGTGEGFFPCAAGMRRFYRAVDLTDGFIGSAEYTYAEDEGRIVVFSDRCGVRELGPKITKYSYVDGELEVERLRDAKKWDESRRQGQINAFYLFTHLINRNVGQLYGHEEVASAWGKEKLRIIESFTYKGQIPTAWLGMYAQLSFYASCPTLGMRKLDGRSLDEGFEILFRSLDLLEEWMKIPDGAELDTGDPMIFGGIKLYKDKNDVKEYIKLPGGEKAPLDDPYSFGFDPDVPYRGLTAEHGWEWFNPARNDPRFKVAIERAKKIKEKYSK